MKTASLRSGTRGSIEQNVLFSCTEEGDVISCDLDFWADGRVTCCGGGKTCTRPKSCWEEDTLAACRVEGRNKGLWFGLTGQSLLPKTTCHSTNHSWTKIVIQFCDRHSWENENLCTKTMDMKWISSFEKQLSMQHMVSSIGEGRHISSEYVYHKRPGLFQHAVPWLSGQAGEPAGPGKQLAGVRPSPGRNLRQTKTASFLISSPFTFCRSHSISSPA